METNLVFVFYKPVFKCFFKNLKLALSKGGSRSIES